MMYAFFLNNKFEGGVWVGIRHLVVTFVTCLNHANLFFFPFMFRQCS
jgi:hypothetical protein